MSHSLALSRSIACLAGVPCLHAGCNHFYYMLSLMDSSTHSPESLPVTQLLPELQEIDPMWHKAVKSLEGAASELCFYFPAGDPPGSLHCFSSSHAHSST